MTRATVFVLGLDDLNLETLRQLPDAEDYDFRPLLSAERLLEREVALPILLAEAERQLADHPGPVDAVMGYWDFPVSSMVPILCARLGLPGPSLEAVVKCEHKYWSRLEQQKVTDTHPRFGLVDLDDERPARPPGLEYPMWLKPVKSASSELAFRVADDEQFERAVEEVRDGIEHFGRPFEFVLDQLDLPAEIARVGGQACLAEEALSGNQVTVEGYSDLRQVHVYGVVDSHTYPDSSSFLRYQYPSTLDAEATERLADVARRVIDGIGLRSSTFNVEFFRDAETGAISILEVNPRHSQSHARLFEHVDGVANHQCMLRLALGREPDLPHRQGPWNVAAKWFVRRFADGVVRRGPTPEEVERLERQVPGTTVQVIANEGDRLSELWGQDSYSFELAAVHVGARDEAELADKYERCLNALTFEIDEVAA